MLLEFYLSHEFWTGRYTVHIPNLHGSFGQMHILTCYFHTFLSFTFLGKCDYQVSIWPSREKKCQIHHLFLSIFGLANTVMDRQTGGWTESEINGEKMEKKSLCVCLCRQHKNKSIEVSVFKYMVHNIFNYHSVYIQKAVDLPWWV